MLSKFIRITIIFIMSLSISISGLGHTYDVKGVGESSFKEYISILRPSESEIVYKNKYLISGVALTEDVLVKAYVFDSKVNDYVEMNNENGESVWKVGNSGVFAENVILPDTGTNKIKIVSYIGNDFKNEQIRKQQASVYTVTYIEKGVKDLVKDSLSKITGMFNKFFK